MTYDIKKTMPLPKLSVGEAFYLRQIWMYNVGVHVRQKREESYFQIWAENEGKRGVNEVCSSLLAFFTIADISSNKLVVWSDSCAGQNKNFATICFWQYVLLSGHFNTTEHKFPEPGHTYLDSNQDFGKVEAAVKKRENIYSVYEYQTLMTNCITNKTKVTVTRMGDKMADISDLARLLGLKKMTRDDDGNKVQLRDKVRWIRISEFGKYSFKHSFTDDKDWKDVLLTSRSNEMLPDITYLSRKAVAIKPSKLQDIRKQMQFIPAFYQRFYVNILNDHPTNADTEVDEQMYSDTSDVEVCEKLFDRSEA